MLLEQFLSDLKTYMLITDNKERKLDLTTFTEFNFMLYFEVVDENYFIRLMEDIYMNS